MHICSAPIQDALRVHLLHHLSPQILAILRTLRRTLQQPADKDTGLVWWEAAQSLVPMKSLPVAQDGHAVQARLSVQAQVAINLIQRSEGELMCWPAPNAYLDS